MGIDYRYNTGYGFLLPEKQFALPEMWADPEKWYDGDVDKEISGSGMTAVYGGNMMTNGRVWGFIATETYTSLDKYSDSVVQPIRDVDPTVIGNVFDIRSRVRRPNARIGWVMWVDIS